MGTVIENFYFKEPVGLALRQKYVNFESFVNQLYLDGSIDKHARNTLLFDKNIAIGMMKIKDFRNKVCEPIVYVYSSSQIHSMNRETVFGGEIKDTRKNLVKLIGYLDSPFALRPSMHCSVFSPLKVNSQNEIGGPGAFTRKFDTEYKILEEFAGILNYYCSFIGQVEVDIYTRLEPCASCKSVAVQFTQTYTNSNVRFYYDKTY